MTDPSCLIAHLQVDNQRVSVNLSNGIDLAIPMSFSGSDPSLYGTPNAEQRPFEADGIVGDTRLGGSCNVSIISFTPHCNGTHTECVGHITHERRHITDVLPTGLLPCTVVSVTPESILLAGESSTPTVISDETMGITATSLENAWAASLSDWNTALVVRTLPNLERKRSNGYEASDIPFFTVEAVRLMRDRGVRHVLVDLPSLDRLHDNGEMAAHRTWWDMEPRSHETPGAADALRTITELIFVPDDIKDGIGFISIQIPPFQSDAAPSRPIFYPLQSA